MRVGIEPPGRRDARGDGNGKDRQHGRRLRRHGRDQIVKLGNFFTSPWCWRADGFVGIELLIQMGPYLPHLSRGDPEMLSWDFWPRCAADIKVSHVSDQPVVCTKFR